MDNERFAELLTQTAGLSEVRGDNPFKNRALRGAARAIRDLDQRYADRLREGTAGDIDGIGKSIVEQTTQMLRDGTSERLETLLADFPRGVLDLLAVKGLGPKRVRQLIDAFDITDLDALDAAARDGTLASLDGFGDKRAEKVVAEIERLRSFAGRVPYARAWPVAQQLVAALRRHDTVARAEVAGSLRRGAETVHDIDLVAASDDPESVMAAFVGHEDVSEVLAHGDDKSSVRLSSGLDVDLIVVPPVSFGAAWHHLTGSKEHNVAMRGRARSMGLRISEWGVFRRDDEDDVRVAGETEAEIFDAVGVSFIPPELRRGAGELAVAEAGTLPSLVTVDAIVGDLHMHTDASDGRHTIAEMAEAAADRGLSYICITDHSQALTIAHGLDRERLLAQIDAIDAYNDGTAAVRVLKGLEVDILADGAIDMDADVLERLDWVIGSVHSSMSQSAAKMTERLVLAVQTGLISAIGHPTGRKIGVREPYAYDFDAVLDACQALGVALEVNASPVRMDLDDRHLRRLLDRPGVWVTINTDAHSATELDQMEHGVRMARRGATPSARVLNTLPLERFLETRRRPQRA